MGASGTGLLELVCAEPTDTPDTGRRLLAKLLKLREESGPDSVYWVGSSNGSMQKNAALEKALMQR